MADWHLHTEMPDASQWDACVQENLFLKSALLPHWSPSWRYFTLGQPFRAVFALPYRRKWGQRYAFQPTLLPWLSVEGRWQPDELKALQTLVFSQFTVVHFTLQCREQWPHLARQWTNYVVPLPAVADQLIFSTELSKNLRKASRWSLQLTSDQKAAEAVALFQQVHGHHHPKAAFNQLTQLAQAMQAQGWLKVYAVEQAGAVVARLLVLDDGQRVSYWMAAPTAEGRQMRALHWGITQLMQRHCGLRSTWQFMGSDLPAVARFYQQFTPVNQPFQELYASRGLVGWLHGLGRRLLGA